VYGLVSDNIRQEDQQFIQKSRLLAIMAALVRTTTASTPEQIANLLTSNM